MLFLIRRLALAGVVLIGFSAVTFCFVASQFPPLQGQSVLPEYWHWLSGVPSGRSLSEGLFGPILPTLLASLGHTLVLLAVALVLVLVFSLAFGTLAAITRGSVLDVLLRSISYVAWAIPPFLLALVVQELFTRLGGLRGLGPFPVAGWPGYCPAPKGLDAGTITPCPSAGTGLFYISNVLRYVTFPAITLAVGFIGLHSRYLRSSLVSALAAPYTTTARAKGLPERKVVLRHALRNSLITFTSALLSDFSAIFGAALVVDWLFQLKGLGSLFLVELGITDLSATFVSVDAYAVEALLLVTALMLLASSVLAELAVVALDPRARLD